MKNWRASSPLRFKQRFQFPLEAFSLSRVDAAFDYEIPQIDFDEDSFVSQAVKDKQYRKNRKVQTFNFGSGDVVLRIYNKSAEISESSGKIWLHNLWGGICEHVWRIEWQVRKKMLRGLGIICLEDLAERQGDLLRRLAEETAFWIWRRWRCRNISSRCFGGNFSMSWEKMGTEAVKATPKMLRISGGTPNLD
ncbi:MAG: hypothetical protein J0L97_04060 [Alphaproteobacteria bacterium]|nr:hypothetical protein [Alphaproteobacteria bacterium]